MADPIGGNVADRRRQLFFRPCPVAGEFNKPLQSAGIVPLALRIGALDPDISRGGERPRDFFEEPMTRGQGDESSSHIYNFAVEALEKHEMKAEQALEEFVDKVFKHDAARGKGFLSRIEMRESALYYLQRVARRLRKRG